MTSAGRCYVRHEHFGAVLYEAGTGRYRHVSHESVGRLLAHATNLRHIHNPRARPDVL